MSDLTELIVPARPFRALVLIVCVLPALALGLALLWTVIELVPVDTGAATAIALMGTGLTVAAGLGLIAALPDLTTRGPLVRIDAAGLFLPRLSHEPLRWDSTDWFVTRHRLLLMRVIGLRTSQPLTPRTPERLFMRLNRLFGLPELTLTIPGLKIDQLSLILSHQKPPVSASEGKMAERR